MAARNASWLRCLCSETGAFGAILQRGHDSFGHRTPIHLHRLVLCGSAAMSLLFLLVTALSQILSARRERDEHRDGPIVLANLLLALSAIQFFFLLGLPFRETNHSQSEFEAAVLAGLAREHIPRLSAGQLCGLSALILHYMHLAAGFWMLSHSLFLYQRLWRPLSTSVRHSRHYSSCSAAADSSEGSFFSSDATQLDDASCSCCCCARLRHRWGLWRFCLFGWATPALILGVSFALNPAGYETRR